MLANGHVMTLANSIIGVGILAMPFCFQKCGIILAILLLIVSNWVTRICCHYLIKSSLLTRRKSFEFLGFHAFGTSGKLLVELCIIGYLLGTCITYFVVVGDLGPQIITKMFSLENTHRHLRTLLMCGVTLFCIIPLGMLKKVDSLSAVCTASIGFYVCLVIKIIMESKTHIILHDWTEKVQYWQPGGVLQCLPIFSMALSCQMQLFEVFSTINNQSLEKLNGIVRNATWICTFVYIAVGFFGYVAFCTQTFSGNILINMSPSFGNDVIKIGFVLSVAFSFPLIIFPCRASLYSLLYKKGQTDATGYIPETKFKVITVFIVIFSLTIALMIPSVELIIGLVGSTIGVAICIMFPAACFRKIVRKESTERSLAQMIILSGFCLMILGTYANLSAIDQKSSGAHLSEVENIKETIIALPTHLVRESLDEKIKNIEKELDKKFVKEEMQDSNSVKTNNGTQEKSSNSAPPAPPLPVDEQHQDEIKKEPEEKKEVNKLEQETLKIDKPDQLNTSNSDKLQAILPVPEQKETAPQKPALPESESKLKAKDNSKAEPTKSPPMQMQQTIDTNAIKKDEEMAKEESTMQRKIDNEELKKTQKELEETKDLLEKKVEELKEELVKQNQKTQELVAEKLGEVVEKFEEIEQKVQQKEQESAKHEKEQRKEITKQNLTELNAIKEEKPLKPSSLLTILTDNITQPEKSEPNAKKPIVYEPLSYKTGELLEYSKNATTLEKRLPLPLALLINASQAKMNESSSLSSLLKENNKQTKNSNSTFASLKNENTNLNLTKDNSDKINVEAIRRDILQLNSRKMEQTTLDPIHSKESGHRFKRSAAIAVAEEEKNCLTEPKLENLLIQSGLEMKIGRDLKSIQETD